MRIIDLGTILIRVLAVFLGLLAIRWLLQMAVWYDLRETTEQLSYLGPGVASFALAVVLWFVPTTIASVVVPKRLHETPVGDIRAREFEEASLGIIGIYILTWAVPDLFYHIGALVLGPGPGQAGAEFETWLLLGTTLVEAAIGLALCLRGPGIYRLIQSARHGGA